MIYGLVATAFLAINMPPFQNPDEATHLMRAAQVAEGRLVGDRFTANVGDGTTVVLGGGPADPAIMLALEPFNAVIAHPDARATRNLWAPRVHWSHERALLGFPNTAINPPFFYLPAAIGVLVGHVSRMTVVQTLALSRLLNGVVAVVVATAAIALAGGAAAWLFAILTLPMSLAGIASASPDALMLACSALAGALLVRLLRCPGDRDGKVLAGLVLALILVATARTPYGALALLPLGLTTQRLRRRLLAAAAVAASALVWTAINAATALTEFGAFRGADPTRQMARLVADPLLIGPLAWNTLALNGWTYLDEFVGRLGWLETTLPADYHTAARAMLGVAAVAAVLGLRGKRISLGSRVIVVAGLLVSGAAVFASEYLVWTPVGDPTVDGVQGRYFLPLALAGAALLPALGETRLARLHKPLVLVVAAFPIISIAVVMRAVVLRYYLG